MNSSIKITGLNLNRPSSSSNRIVAHFDVEVAGIEIKGCALIRTAKDGISISTPHLDTHSAQRGVHFVDSALRSAVTYAARSAYRRLGGIDLPAWALTTDAEVA